MKIDIFCHIVPQNYYDRMMKLPEIGTTIKKRTANIPAMVNLDVRFRMMDRFRGLLPGREHGRASDRSHGGRKTFAGARAGGQRRHGGTGCEASRPLPGIRGGAADE